MEKPMELFKKELNSAGSFFVYGAGHVADIVCRFLERENLLEKCQGVLVKDVSTNPSMFYGKKVEEYTNALSHIGKIVIALAASGQRAVYDELSKKGVPKERICCLSESLLEELKEEEAFRKNMEAVERGYRHAKRIIPENDVAVHWFIKNQHIGDAARTFRVLKAFREYYSGTDPYYFSKDSTSLGYDWTRYVKNTICKRVNVISTNSIAGVARLAPWVDETVILSKEELYDLELYANSSICRHPNLHPDDRQDWLREAFYKVGTYNWQLLLPNESRPIELKVTEEALLSGTIVMREKKIDAEKTVLLCPWALSSTYLPEEIWDRIVSKCVELGYRVFTNVGPKEQELHGTERMEEPIDTVVGLVQQGVRVIGLQSGLTDILLWAGVTAPLCILNYGKTDMEISFAKGHKIDDRLVRKGNLTYMLFTGLQDEDIWNMILEYMEETL